MEEIKNNKDIGSIQLVGEKTENLPMWTINYYLQELCNNYNKVIILQKICEMLQIGMNPSRIYLAKESGELLPKKIEKLEKSQKVIDIYSDCFSLATSAFFPSNILSFLFYALKDNMSVKYMEEMLRKDFYNLSKDNKTFWDHLFQEPRPLVFLKSSSSKYKWHSIISDVSNDDALFFPLIDFSSQESIKITSMNYSSPVTIESKGLISGLIDLAYAGQRNERDDISFINDQIGKSTENLSKIVRTSQVINDERTPNGYKQYAELTLQQLLDCQLKLNESLGIKLTKINLKV